MDKDKLKLIVRNLELLVDSLKTELYSDVQAYQFDDITPKELDYDKKAIKLIKEALKQDYLYSGEEIQFMKAQLSVLELEKQNSKEHRGFGKK